MSASPVTPALRDRLMTAFRAYLCEKIDFVPFQHQAAWWASTDGQVLGPDDTGPHTMTVRLPSRRVVARTITPRPQGRARVVADLGARTLVAYADLPIGMLTSLVGGPFFFWLIRRARRTSGAWA